LLTVLILGACANAPPVPPPDWQNALPEENPPVVDPKPLPILCEIPWHTVECWATIEQFEEIADNNTGKAQKYATGLRKTERAYDALVEGGEMQQTLSEFYRMNLEAEQQKRWLDNTIWKGVLGLVVVGVVASR